MLLTPEYPCISVCLSGNLRSDCVGVFASRKVGHSKCVSIRPRTVPTSSMPNKKSRKQNRGKGTRVVALRPPGHLPQRTDQFTFNYVIRYASLEATITLALTLQPYQLINSLLCYGTGVHSVLSIVQAIKVRKIEAWCPPAIATSGSAGGAAYGGNTIRLGWVSSATGNPNFGRDRAVTDTSMGIDCAHAVLKPVPGTSSAMWQISGSNQPWELFYSLPPASVMDIHLSMTLNCQESATTDNAVQTVSGSPANGILYNIALVGTSGQLFPQNGNGLA